MKLFFLITKSEAGGAQTHVAQLTKFFVARGDDVAIMSAPSFAEASEGRPGGWLEQEVHNLGAKFFPNPSLSNSANPLRLWRASRALSCAIRDFQPDLFACHSTIAGLLGRFTMRNRIPTVFTAHGWGFLPGAPLLRRLILPTLERVAARFCSRIICVSQNDLALARRHRIAPECKLVQIYNGVEIPSSESQRSLRSSSDSSVGMTMGNNINIFFIGRLAPPKDPFLLIRAVAQLPIALRDLVRVTIIGNGPQMPALRDLIRESQLENHVSLLGALPRVEVLRRLEQEADIFVLISHFEGFPYSILEAMARGIPVIANNVGGIKEAVTTNVGKLVDDQDSLVHALTRIIQDPAERLRLGANARTKSQNQFSVETMCEKTLEVYQSLI